MPSQLYEATFWFIGMVKLSLSNKALNSLNSQHWIEPQPSTTKKPLTSPKSGFRDWLRKAMESLSQGTNLGLVSLGSSPEPQTKVHEWSDTAHETLMKRTSYDLTKLYACCFLLHLKVLCSFNFWGSTEVEVICFVIFKGSISEPSLACMHGRSLPSSWSSSTFASEVAWSCCLGKGLCSWHDWGNIVDAPS